MVDTSIAMGYKPIEVQNPMNQLAQMMQIKAAQQSGQMNAMKMDQYTRTKERQNKLLALMGQMPADANDDQRSAALKGAGYFDEADKLQTGILNRRKIESEAGAKEWETKSKKLDYMSQAFGYVKDNPTPDAAIAVNRHLGEVGIFTPEQVAQAEAAIRANPSPDYIRANATRAFQSSLSAKDQLPKLEGFNAGNRYVQTARNPITGASTETGSTAIGQSADNAATVANAARTASMVDARARAGQAQSAQQHAATLAQGGKPPPGYRYTPDGNMQAIPGGPADAKASALAQQKALGASDVDSAIATLRDAYGRLEVGGGITSTASGPIGNLAASTSSSSVGQMVGRALGTNNQSARNDIAMTRPALLAALMKATGMSAKQMDSNAELKLWLATATDPTLDVESNRRALNAIERKYIPNGQPFNAVNLPAPSGSAKNNRGWSLMTDANGNKAYVSPDGKQFEEVQ